jgi:hypothetical protein
MIVRHVDEDAGGLEVRVDHSSDVRVIERIGDLGEQLEGARRLEWPIGDRVRERGSLGGLWPPDLVAGLHQVGRRGRRRNMTGLLPDRG